ncbi:MAG: AzlD domain-containing protein [Solobacterium sp.]|nr:AzlD domain-containing protein [Solobacterium sp.]
MNLYLFTMILAASLVTVLLRFLPFWVLKGRRTPDYIVYLGNVLPYSIMGMLVVYCLKETSLLKAPYGIPETISVLITVLIHRLRRNTLLSILAGTVCYMFLIQAIFR